MQYYAKSENASGQQQTVHEHLEAVTKLAKENAVPFGMEAEAAAVGQLHDFGKYSQAFQQVLLQEEHGIDHAIGGAMFLEAYSRGAARFHPLIEVVNGHHDGLTAYEALKPTLHAIAAGKPGITGNAGKKPAIQNSQELKTAIAAFQQDFPSFQRPNFSAFSGSQLESMLYTRMLFSCLVDADYSASAQNDDPDYLERTKGEPLKPAELMQALYAYRDGIRNNSNADTILNQYREEVFQKCGQMGSQREGLFTLTAPTGTGKTLALLHFALQHCLNNNKKRIIIVLPFLTLAEQNAAVYSSIIPDVLIDHSQSNLSEESRELAARWSAPVIITTSVRFFESLFSDRPTVCRKLHHIADSVVIFDEAQSLPAELTATTLRAVNDLCRRYHTTMVFSTATQPDYSAVKDLEWLPIEILPDHARLFQALQRVDVDWRIENSTPLEQISREMAAQRSVCAIFNLRRHARELSDSLRCLCSEEEIFYLTTDLCPAHRSAVIQTIRFRLANNLPCRVVATQCIEAGVDLDFDVLYRALAPLDAIIQAAGRCNRNGRLPKGQVTVFVPEDSRNPFPDTLYSNAAHVVREMRPPFSIHDPDNIREYYRRLFADVVEKAALQKAIEARSYQDTAKEYKLIANSGAQVIVPYVPESELYDRIVQSLRQHGVTGGLLKEAASITVTCFAKELDVYAEQIPFANAKHQADSNVYLLHPQYEQLYSESLGLHIPKEERHDFIF